MAAAIRVAGRGKNEMVATMSVDIESGRTVRAGGRDIFVAELGEGPPLLMLHGAGPGATGAANFVRNIPALAECFRLVVPDMPGYGRSTKGVDRNDPFGDLGGAMLVARVIRTEGTAFSV